MLWRSFPGPLLFVKRHDLPLCRPGGKSNWHWAYCMSVEPFPLNCSESKGSFFCIVLEGFLLPCPKAAAGRTLMSQGTDWALLNASEETSAVLNCTDEFVWNSDVLDLEENSCLLKRIWTVAGTTRRAATCFCPPQTVYTPALQFLTASYLLPSHLQSLSFDKNSLSTFPQEQSGYVLISILCTNTLHITYIKFWVCRMYAV